VNPRLVEPGFVAVCLHVDVPARARKDENGEDDAQATRHGTEGYLDNGMPGKYEGKPRREGSQLLGASDVGARSRIRSGTPKVVATIGVSCVVL
jgi:hypothetical protein